MCDKCGWDINGAAQAEKTTLEWIIKNYLQQENFLRSLRQCSPYEMVTLCSAAMRESIAQRIGSGANWAAPN